MVVMLLLHSHYYRKVYKVKNYELAMEKIDISGLENLKDPEYLKNLPNIDGSFGGEFSGLGSSKVSSLKQTIEEINEMIAEREVLSANVFKEGEKLKMQINNFLIENKNNKELEDIKGRNDLRNKQIEVSELQLNDKVSCWKDIAILKKELRDRERELFEKEERSKMLGRILEE